MNAWPQSISPKSACWMVRELKEGLQAMDFSDPNFRGSKYMRLEVLKGLREKGLLDGNLEWIRPHR